MEEVERDTAEGRDVARPVEKKQKKGEGGDTHRGGGGLTRSRSRILQVLGLDPDLTPNPRTSKPEPSQPLKMPCAPK